MSNGDTLTEDDFFDPLRRQLLRELLRYSCSRQIFCSITGEILDVRSAVYYEVDGKPYVNSADGYHLNVLPALRVVGKTPTNVIDGADLRRKEKAS